MPFVDDANRFFRKLDLGRDGCASVSTPAVINTCSPEVWVRFGRVTVDLSPIAARELAGALVAAADHSDKLLKPGSAS